MKQFGRKLPAKRQRLPVEFNRFVIVDHGRFGSSRMIAGAVESEKPERKHEHGYQDDCCPESPGDGAGRPGACRRCDGVSQALCEEKHGCPCAHCSTCVEVVMGELMNRAKRVMWLSGRSNWSVRSLSRVLEERRNIVSGMPCRMSPSVERFRQEST